MGATRGTPNPWVSIPKLSSFWMMGGYPYFRKPPYRYPQVVAVLSDASINEVRRNKFYWPDRIWPDRLLSQGESWRQCFVPVSPDICPLMSTDLHCCCFCISNYIILFLADITVTSPFSWYFDLSFFTLVRSILSPPLFGSHSSKATTLPHIRGVSHPKRPMMACNLIFLPFGEQASNIQQPSEFTLFADFHDTPFELKHHSVSVSRFIFHIFQICAIHSALVASISHWESSFVPWPLVKSPMTSPFLGLVAWTWASFKWRISYNIPWKTYNNWNFSHITLQ